MFHKWDFPVGCHQGRHRQDGKLQESEIVEASLGATRDDMIGEDMIIIS